MSGSGTDYFSGVGSSTRNYFYILFPSYTCSPQGKMSENNEATLYILKLQDGEIGIRSKVFEGGNLETNDFPDTEE